MQLLVVYANLAEKSRCPEGPMEVFLLAYVYI